MAKTTIFKSEKGKASIIHYYENVLQEWHKPNKQFFLDTAFGKTFIIESGNADKPAVLLLHGTGSNSAMWLADIAELSKHFHVFAIDILGECGKSTESRPAFSQNTYARWLHEIIMVLGLDVVSLVGCSLGGWIALEYTIQYPAKVNKLILLATAGVVQVKLYTIFWIIITSFFGKWGFNKINKMVYHSVEIDTRALEFATLVKESFSPRTDLLSLFSDEQLSAIEASVLFLGGDNDCFYNSTKLAERLGKYVAECECNVLENVGHVLINQTKTIVRFLKGGNHEE